MTGMGKWKCLILAVFSFLFFACEADIPVKELVSAKESIEQARLYMAEKYSPQELKSSESLIYDSHTKLKEEKTDEAKKLALESYKSSQKALKKSLPLYSTDLINETEEMIKSAENAFAEKLSTELFVKARELHIKAKSENDSKEYIAAIETSIEAKRYAVQASIKSSENASTIRESHRELTERVQLLSSQKDSRVIQGELLKAGNSLGNIKKLIDSNMYKEAFFQLNSTSEEIAAAEKKLKKHSYKSKISELRESISTILSKNSGKTLKLNLDKASVMLNKAESFLEQNDIAGTEENIKTAEDLIGKSNSIILMDSLNSKIEDVEGKIGKARKLDSLGKEKENIETAEGNISNARELMNSGSYGESESKIKDADELIISVLRNLDKNKETTIASSEGLKTKSDKKAEEKVKTQIKTDKAAETYTVKWRKKNTDCLWRISQKLYNDASLWPAIYLANRDQIKDPDLIFPGQKLKIPPKPNKRPPLKLKRDNKALRKEK